MGFGGFVFVQGEMSQHVIHTYGHQRDKARKVREQDIVQGVKDSRELQ